MKPVLCDKATEESNPVNQKLIVTNESDLQVAYAKQRRTKSSILLRKELDSRGKIAARDYLFHVNEATAVVYARHVLASLLAEWPDGVPLKEDILELSGPAHITYILNMLMHLEEKQLWEKVRWFINVPFYNFLYYTFICIFPQRIVTFSKNLLAHVIQAVLKK